MTQKTNRIYLLEEAHVASALLKLGIPTMLGMLISAMYNAIDAYFVGGLGISQMGAVSVVFPIVQIIIGLGMMFGAGASSYISRLLGKGDNKQADKTASTSLFSGLLAGSVIIIGILVFLDPILISLGSTATILPYARAYAKIYVTGSIINVFTVMMNNLLTAQGATKFTMIAMLTGSITNVILDPIMIYSMDLGVEGAAIATVISLCINMLLYIGYIAKRKGVLRFAFKNIAPSKTIYTEVLKIGIPVLLFQLLASAAMGAINTAAKPYGDYAVAAMGAVIRIMTVAAYAVFGFLKGFQPFAGYNYGAKKFDRLKTSIHLCLVWSTGFCVIAAIVLALFSNPIVSLFGNDTEMIHLAGKALKHQRKRINIRKFKTYHNMQCIRNHHCILCAISIWKIGSILHPKMKSFRMRFFSGLGNHIFCLIAMITEYLCLSDYRPLPHRLYGTAASHAILRHALLQEYILLRL